MCETCVGGQNVSLGTSLTLDRAKNISISANLFPTQARTPTPKGMKLYGWWRGEVLSPQAAPPAPGRSQRSGAKSSAPSNCSSS